MKITIEINTNNAAFEDNENQMRDIIDQFSFMFISGKEIGYLFDINGNKVGNFKVEDK